MHVPICPLNRGVADSPALGLRASERKTHGGLSSGRSRWTLGKTQLAMTITPRRYLGALNRDNYRFAPSIVTAV